MRPLIAQRGPGAGPSAPLRRRDPAPSRIAYRLNRLWLTPLVRTAVRVGLPAFALAFSAGLYLADDNRREALSSVATDLRERIKNRPEFTVSTLAVTGASPTLAEAARGALALRLPQSSFDLDLGAARDRVAALDAVSDVQMRIESGGALTVSITERQPAIVWRNAGVVRLLDTTGHRVQDIATRADRQDLPLVTGQGADRAVPEALAIIQAAGPLAPRLRGLVRMGERRWDVVLDRDQRILLPVEGPVAAFERLLALDQAQGLLARDVTAVDLRLRDRPTLRLAPYALAELRLARGITPPAEPKP